MRTLFETETVQHFCFFGESDQFTQFNSQILNIANKIQLDLALPATDLPAPNIPLTSSDFFNFVIRSPTTYLEHPDFFRRLKSKSSVKSIKLNLSLLSDNQKLNY